MAVAIDPKDVNDFLYGLYREVSAGKTSVSCRKQNNLSSNFSFIYGESHLPSLNEIFLQVSPQPGEVFYDFGSGGGRVVLFAALSFPFSKTVGIELLDGLVSLANNQLKLMRERLPYVSNFDASKLGKIEFINDDFTKVNVNDADIIYIASTCFSGKLMWQTATFLENQVKVGTRVITCAQRLPSEKFKVNKSEIYSMEWGQSTIYFQEKI